jgi:hypothetical protein
MRFSTWNARSLNNSGSLRTVVWELTDYKLDVVDVGWGVKVGHRGYTKTCNLLLFLLKKKYHQFGTGYCTAQNISS